MTSQHNSTTHIDKGLEEPHSIYYKHGSHDPTYRAYKKRKHNMSEYRQLQKKRLRSPTIYKTLQRYKLLVEVHENTSKTEVSAAKT